MENKISNVAERLKELMLVYRLKQQDIAKRTGLDYSTISLYVNGKREPKADKVTLIAEKCGVSPTWLLGYDVNMTSGIIAPKTVQTDLVALVATDVRYHNLMEKAALLNEEQLDTVYNLICSIVDKE